ncbi:MAG: hypothetical protein ACKVQK_16720, partial [Burkholderiales bacterium]
GYASSSLWSTPTGSSTGDLTVAFQSASGEVPLATGVSIIGAFKNCKKKRGQVLPFASTRASLGQCPARYDWSLKARCIT